MCKKKKIVNLSFQFVFSICFINQVTVYAQENACTDGSTVGPDDPQKFNKKTDPDPGHGYVTYGDLYKVKCCGVVTRWEFSVGRDTGDIELQVWRPTDSSNEKFELVGVNKDTVQKKDKKNGYVIYDVEEIDQIAVKEGDVMGWYNPEDSLVEYDPGTNYNDIWKLNHDDSVRVGSEVDFSDGERQRSRTYGIQMTLAKNTPPKFKLLLPTSMGMDAEEGSLVYVLNVGDDNKAHEDTLSVEMVTSSEFFDFDSTSNKITVKKRLSVPEEGQTFTLNFTVTDECGDEGNGTLKVRVSYVEPQTLKPPVTTTSTTTESTTTTQSSTRSTTEATTQAIAITATVRDDSPTASEKEKETKPDKVDDEDKIPFVKPTKKTSTSVENKDTPEDAAASGTAAKDTGEDDTDPELASNTGLVVGIVIAVVIVVIIVVGGVAYCLSKKKRTQTAPSDAENGTKTPAKAADNVKAAPNGVQAKK